MRVLLRNGPAAQAPPPLGQDGTKLPGGCHLPPLAAPTGQAGEMRQTRFGIVVTVRAPDGALSTRLLAVHFDKREEAEAVVRQLADVRGAEFRAVPLELNSPVKS
jgi:hypothetical protein